MCTSVGRRKFITPPSVIIKIVVLKMLIIWGVKKN
jgi:hypothetical protein